MTEKERLLCVLKGGKPDKIPWYADLSYFYDSLYIKGMLDKRYEGDEGYLQFHIDLGTGICFYPPFLWKVSYLGGVEYKETQENNQKICEFSTPIGKIIST